MNQADKERSATRQTKVSSLQPPASSLSSPLPGLPPSGSTGSAPKTARPFCPWLLAVLLAGLAAPSLAEDAPQPFAIPPQALSDALTEFAEEADLKLVSDAALLRGLPSPGVSGTLTPAEGLERLLAGTGMRHPFVDADTVTIERAPEASPPPEPLAQAVSGVAKARDFSGKRAIRSNAVRPGLEGGDVAGTATGIGRVQNGGSACGG